MKTNLGGSVLIFLLMLAACQKEIEAPIEFITEYRTLGPYDDSGKPQYLLPREVISPELLLFLDTTLLQDEDLRITNPQLINNAAIADINITTQSDVFVTFVSAKTSYTNALGFYTYPTGQSPASPEEIRTITYIFPSAGNDTPLEPGDKVRIGTFKAGITIGFVIMHDGWNTTTETLDNKAEHFYSTDVLNPEVDPNLKKHAVFINYVPENKKLIGFENVNRSSPDCNHDFNDLVFYATITK